MKVSLKKAFSILDGRLSTEIGDVYEMLNYIFDQDFMTHQLPTALTDRYSFFWLYIINRFGTSP